MSESLKERWKKLDERIKNLFKRYYLVGTTLLVVGGVIGFVTGKLT